MKLFAWFNHFSFHVIVLAHDVDEARRVALTKISDTDGSCKTRNAAIERVRDFNPDIWQHNPVCFTAFSEGENDEVHFN